MIIMHFTNQGIRPRRIASDKVAGSRNIFLSHRQAVCIILLWTIRRNSINRIKSRIEFPAIRRTIVIRIGRSHACCRLPSFILVGREEFFTGHKAFGIDRSKCETGVLAEATRWLAPPCSRIEAKSTIDFMVAQTHRYGRHFHEDRCFICPSGNIRFRFVPRNRFDCIREDTGSNIKGIILFKRPHNAVFVIVVIDIFYHVCCAGRRRDAVIILHLEEVVELRIRTHHGGSIVIAIRIVLRIIGFALIHYVERIQPLRDFKAVNHPVIIRVTIDGICTGSQFFHHE